MPVKNSLDLANRLAKLNIKFELHIFPDAPHGGALYNETTSSAREEFVKPRYAEWIKMATDWANEL